MFVVGCGLGVRTVVAADGSCALLGGVTSVVGTGAAGGSVVAAVVVTGLERRVFQAAATRLEKGGMSKLGQNP